MTLLPNLKFYSKLTPMKKFWSRLVMAVFLVLVGSFAWYWQARAAFGTGGATCTAGSKTTETSLSCTIATENLDAGNIAILWFGGDNTASADGNDGLLSSVTDTGGNAWTVQRCYTNSQGSAASGSTTCLAWSKLTTTLTSGSDSITANFSSITAKGIVVKEFTIASGFTFAVTGTPQDLANDGVDPGSMTVGSLASSEHLFICATALERPTGGTWTQTASHTSSTCNGTASQGATSNIDICGEYRIFTGTTDTSNPTGTAVDNASTFIAFDAVPVTTLSDGTDPSNATIAPSAGATMAGAFQFQTASGTDVISAVVVGLGSGASTGISLVEITSDDGATVYGSTAPGSDTPSITLSTNTLTATTSLTQYKIRITPKTHANMAAPNGATYTATAKINSWTSTNDQAGSDTAGTTITIDNSSPTSATSTSGTVGDTTVALNWTTSASTDISRSVVLRWTATTAGSEDPAEGTDYSVGNTITTATVVCVRTGESASTTVSGTDGGGGNCSATALSNGTAYSYKIFQKDTNGNYDTGVAVNNKVPNAVTLSDGTDPGNSTLAPSAAATMAGAFKLQMASGTDTISSLVVGLGSGASAGISLVEITNDAGSTVYGSSSNPASDTPTVTLSTNTLTATTSLIQYKIRITPKTHTNMPAPAGATYTVTAKVNSITPASATTAGSDTAGTTLIIDNTSPTSVTATSGTAGNASVALNWTTSASADISRSVVLRWTAASAGSEVPAEGVDYSVNNIITTATVVCVRTGESVSTAVSGTDGGNCNSRALSNGTAYSYKIFQKDTNGNYDTGVAVNNQIPVGGYNNYGASVQGTISFQGGTSFKVARPFVCGDTTTFTYNGSTVTYGSVTGADSKCWMDRNLGATQVATSATDTASYGDLFQWGRSDDGHQVPTSGTTATNADIPGNNLFITETVSPYDWRVTPSDTLWANSHSTNNPCPASWHIPTQTEWATWVTAASVTNSATVFSSTLKLPLAGFRNNTDAILYYQGSIGYYWSSSPNGTNVYNIDFDSGVAPGDFSYRARGLSVRCVKD